MADIQQLPEVPVTASGLPFKDYNGLHEYRSYNSLFTLSALPNSALLDPNKEFPKVINQLVIAKSSGKSATGFDGKNITPIYKDEAKEYSIWTGYRSAPQLVEDSSTKALIEAFNKKSAGRFNFYFSEVEIDTFTTPNSKIGLTKSSKISFTINEPLGLAGFMEALQAGALAAGHPTAVGAPYLLKLEFMGYKDTDDNTVVKIPQSDRYFAIKFTEIQVKSDDTGTKYFCKAIPFNEMGYGNSGRLDSSITASGNYVKDILTDLFSQINLIKKKTNYVNPTATGDNAHSDEYEIRFPSVVKGNLLFDQEYEYFSSKNKVAELDKENVNYDFSNPVDTATAEVKKANTKSRSNTAKKTPSVISVPFSANSNISDCITAIMRDSDAIKNIIRDSKSKIDPEDQTFDYFSVGVKVEPKKIWDTSRHQPFVKYIYYVIPYRMHQSAIPELARKVTDIDKLASRIYRTYDYLYTGKNVDILRFNLTFNYLFYQSQTINDGNFSYFNQKDSMKNVGTYAYNNLQIQSTDVVATNGMGPTPYRVDPATVEFTPLGGTTKISADPYAALVKNLHSAIVNNLSSILIDIDIIGDPLYISQNGIGNQIKKSSDDVEILEDGSLDTLTGDIFVVLNFKYPSDTDNTNYDKIEWSQTVSFSGVYKIASVTSKFNDGAFTQSMRLYRVPGQPLDLGLKKNTSYSTLWDGLGVVGQTQNTYYG